MSTAILRTTLVALLAVAACVAIVILGRTAASIASNIQAVAVRLETLDSMNRKLDRLQNLSTNITIMRRQLTMTNALLTHKIAGSFLFKGVK
jgi:hypothetical protein